MTFRNQYADSAESSSMLISDNGSVQFSEISCPEDDCDCSFGDTPISTPTIKSPFSVRIKKGINPSLYFLYLKKSFKLLERVALERRMKELEKAFEKVMSNGQLALGEKLRQEIIRETKESALYAKGFTAYIEREDAFKFKRSLSTGHISDTKFKDYTRVIPDKVLERKKEVESLFDGFVIFHYWNEKQPDVAKMPEKEKAKMRDPILFGVIAESDRLYFIADWEDEFCTLTFKEMIKVLGKDKQGKITKKIELKV